MKCTTCGAAIIFARTTRGRRMPLDAAPADDGAFVVRVGVAMHRGPGLPGHDPTEPRYTSHFATCPQAAEHRSSR